MTFEFKPVDQFEQLQAYASWDVIESFSIQNIYVDASGLPVSGFYHGRAYLLLSEIEKTYSLFERIKRVISGILVVLATLFIVLYVNSIRDLFSAEHGKIRIGLLTKDSDPVRAHNGVSIVANILQNIDKNCLNHQVCTFNECQEKHLCTHTCLFTNKEGTEFQKILNAIEIRDILNWPSQVKIENREHFTQIEKPLCLKKKGLSFHNDLQGFTLIPL